MKVIGSKQEFKAELSAHPRGLVVVDFSATWCGPCQRMAPLYAEFSTTYPNVRFLEVDVDRVPDVAQECGVTAMPTFHFYQGGRKVDELRGADPNRLQDLIKRHGATSTLSGGGGGGGSDGFGGGGSGYRLGGGGDGDGGATTAAPAVSRGGGRGAQRTGDAEAVVQSVMGLGFSRGAALAGIQATGTTELESVVDWVLQNRSLADTPEEERGSAGGGEEEPNTASAPSAQPVATAAASGPKTTLAIRLTDGSTLKHEFNGGDRLLAVHDFIARHRTDGSAGFDLMTPYPRKIFGAADLDRTLAELDLVPNANLILHKK